MYFFFSLPLTISEDTNSRPTENVTPDYLISIEDGELKLQLNGKNAPELNISREYKGMLEHYRDSKGKATKSEKDALMFVKQKIDAAKWFIDAIRQRQQTLILTMSTIMEYQKEYFLTGDERKLRPMILKDIADKIDMDISTVSRVASNKFVQTPYGTFLIKTFFLNIKIIKTNYIIFCEVNPSFFIIKIACSWASKL